MNYPDNVNVGCPQSVAQAAVAEDSCHLNTPVGDHYLQDDRLLTAKDLQYIFSVGKNRAYELMNSKAFPSLQIGSRKYVSRTALQEWVKTYTGKEYLI